MVASLNVRVYVACAAALYLKHLITTGIQGGKTFKSGGRPPEDNKLSLAKGNPKQNYGLNGDVKDEKVLKAREVEHRWRRIVANDLESIPFALFVFAGGVLANANEVVFAATMIVYTVARCLHSYAYAHQMQPHRALFWFIAVLCILAGAGNAIVAAYL
ncbi:hypothetical protein P43SY_004075 [Pythium insidiosum]|uniref:Microsomal glutathione S-transferase 1 n=1 Tax=Pythium insidiosum TaxID=114742 RepID=A0AAD5LEE8_PYTIN|nr:hypothetical protein P43SY_004075 [Pythium insidiosum]